MTVVGQKTNGTSHLKLFANLQLLDVWSKLATGRELSAFVWSVDFDNKVDCSSLANV